MLRREIRFILADLVAIVTDSKWGLPCAALINAAIAHPDLYEHLVNRMATESHGEFVLNGAGLILSWENRDHLTRPLFFLHGDQTILYPVFDFRARKLLGAWNRLAISTTKTTRR